MTAPEAQPSPPGVDAAPRGTTAPRNPRGPALVAEITRKLLHLTSATTPIVYIFLDRALLLKLLAPCTVLAVLIETARHVFPGFAGQFRKHVGFMVREAEWTRITGATYVMVAALLSVLLFPKPVAIAGLLVLSISDSAASLVGITWGRTRLLGKSLEGSLAFFVTALAVFWIALPDTRGAGFVAALVATFVEALPSWRFGRFELNDNLLIPLVSGALLWLLRDGVGLAHAAAQN